MDDELQPPKKIPPGFHPCPNCGELCNCGVVGDGCSHNCEDRTDWEDEDYL